MEAQQRPWRLFTLAVFLGLTLVPLVRPGMFMDGLLYLTVAHNQAHGFGSFWEPRFSQEGLLHQPIFSEHPPLAFGMEAQWFRVFGDAFWVEGAYSLAMAALTAMLLVALWRTLWPAGDPSRRSAWLAVLFWIVVPQVHWCVQHNMQENTMAVFTVAAVLVAVRSAHGNIPFILGSVLVGMLTLAAGLVKGPPGLFPVVAPALYAAIGGIGRRRRGIFGSAVATLTVAGGLALLLAWPEARESLERYADGRLLHRIEQDPTVDFRWRTLQHLFLAMLGPLVVTVIILVVGRKNAGHVLANPTRKAAALIAIGLAGVLPLMLTMVQKSFYMVAALPMISIGLALFAAPHVARWTEFALGERTRQWLSQLGVVVVAGVLLAAILFFGRPSRDADLLHDTALIGKEVAPHSLVSATPSVREQWNLQSYLMRYHFISLTENSELPYVLTEWDEPGPEGYERVPLSTQRIHLWRR